MTPKEFLNALIDAQGDPEAVKNIPGAFRRRLVAKHSYSLRPLLPQLNELSNEDLASFVKSLAIYEETVGSLGSATMLDKVFEAITDEDHHLFDWVLANTISYDYFRQGANTFGELQEIKATKRARAAYNLEQEAKREAAAKAQRAVKATGNLINAIKRGDLLAVEALLRKGASINAESSDGLQAADYARNIGQEKIAQLISDWT